MGKSKKDEKYLRDFRNKLMWSKLCQKKLPEGNKDRRKFLEQIKHNFQENEIWAII